jgi:hypothetical protein
MILKLLERIRRWQQRGIITDVVKQTDFVHPEKNLLFIKYVPEMHHYEEVMQYVGGYGNLSELYCKTILKHFNGNLPFEIEKAVILDAHSNMLYDLTRIGYKWSRKAVQLIKNERSPWDYKFVVEQSAFKE